MPSPRHLWSGSWREESDSHQPGDASGLDRGLQAGPETPAGSSAFRAPDREPADAPPRRGRRRLIVAGALAATAATGAVGGALLAGDGNAPGRTTVVLPAATTQAAVQPTDRQSQTGAIYAKASPAVVSISTGSGSGTGFLVDDTRTIVTNAHVVESSKTVKIRFGADGRDIQGTVQGVDPSSDLAVVRVPAGSAPRNAQPLGLADSSSVKVGDTVVAIGNPFGLDRTATEGIVSGLGRDIQAPNGFQISNAIQTDAPINPGNSGGPLIDATGVVIGVNSQIETSGGNNGNVGIGFAVPADTVREVVPQLERGETIQRAYLGVSTQASSGGSGAEVNSVVAGGPAQDGGVQAGDVVQKVAGKPVRTSSDVAKIVDDLAPGEKVDVEVRRGGSQKTLQITLGLRPARTTP